MKADAQERYERAQGKKNGVPPGQAKREEELGNAEYTFSNNETQALIQNGWNKKNSGDEKNHGQYVSKMVHVAKDLGYSAREGALQANFLPEDWYEKQAELREAEAVMADSEATEAEKEAAQTEAERLAAR